MDDLQKAVNANTKKIEQIRLSQSCLIVDAAKTVKKIDDYILGGLNSSKVIEGVLQDIVELQKQQLKIERFKFQNEFGEEIANELSKL